MLNTRIQTFCAEPYRIFFPLGIISLICGVLLWVSMLWDSGDYPISLHRYLVLNGFVASFIGGFLMTAVPKFSKTFSARPFEVAVFFVLTVIGVFLNEPAMFYVSALQVVVILFFLFSRIFKRKENPPYSFVFIFVGLFLWLAGALGSAFLDAEAYKQLHYEGAIAAIILGVGSRLIPGIFGHVEIVSAQRERYEKPVPIISTVPLHFFFLIVLFVASYFRPYPFGEVIRLLVVLTIALLYWRLYQLPKIRSALTYCIWFSGWLIVTSFALKTLSDEGGIHYSHSFFINGIVLLCLLVATRVLQSHGPKDPRLENWKGLYFVTGILFLAAATRVSAFLLPKVYLTHLAYSSILVTLAVIIWGLKYIRFSVTMNEA